MTSLDSSEARRYIARPLAMGLLGVALCLGAGARADVIGGVQLPNGVVKVGENRYRSPTDFEGTLKYFKTVYPSERFPRKSIVNQPGVKAIHISNPSGKVFEGLNVYESNDEVRIYILKSSKK
jgi:hypothetical protein